MNLRAAPWAPILVGMGALVLVLVRVVSGHWDMVTVVISGIVGALAVLLLYLQWDRNIYRRTLRRLDATGRFDLLVGGYLTSTEIGNVGRGAPRRGEIVLGVGANGVEIHSVTDQRAPMVTIGWPDVIDLAPAAQEFLGQQQRGLVISTMQGRLGLVLRSDPARGILSVGGPATDTFIEAIRRLRPGSTVG